MDTLLQQLKKRRLDLDLKQSDMMLRVGISRQQYQRLESKGNPRLDTLELIAKALNSEIILIPKEKLGTVVATLEDSTIEKPKLDSQSLEFDNTSTNQRKPSKSVNNKKLSDDPWQNLLGDDS